MLDPTFLIILALAFGAFWLMSSRTRKQQKAAQEFRNNLAPGDEIMTGSGLFGTVVEVDGDVITVESTPGTRTRWIRAAIAKQMDPQVEDDTTDEDDETEDDADRIARANDEVIDVPDDLSSLPPVLRKKDDEPDTK